VISEDNAFVETSTPEPAPKSTGSADRRHDLDALRAFAMLLGIALHGALSFAPFPWLVQDTQQHGAYLVFFHIVHGFRMPLFFIVSGFFTAMLWRRRGLKALLKHRARRVALPLLIGMVTIIPVLIVSTVAAVAMSVGGGGEELDAQARLSDAVRSGDADAVNEHLEAGSDLNEQDPTSHVTPLCWATMCDEVEIAALLLDSGADPDARNIDGATPLIGAAFLGRADAVKLLLDRGADPDARDNKGARAIDTTLADRGTTEWIAGMLQLKLDWDEVEAGRRQLRPLLEAASAAATKGDGESDTAQKPAGKTPPDDNVNATVTEESHGKQPDEADEPERDKDRELHPVLSQYRDWLHSDGIAGLVYTPLFHHMWFLWFLCWLVAMFAVYAMFADAIGWAGPPRLLVVSPLRLLWLLPLTLVPQYFMGLDAVSFGPDTSVGLLPQPHLLAYYGVFFGFGALYYDCDDPEGRLGRWWWLSLPLGLLVAYPIGVDSLDDRPVTAMAQVVYVWAMSFGLIGLFRKCLSEQNEKLRYVSDSSYWLYLAHLPLIFLGQAIVRTWAIPSILKFVLLCAGVTALLLVSYEYLVRYTLIGRLLNGPRSRNVNT
jgi:peptidoglycan/LPS O-acetylase OafA/YrhL